MYFDRQTIINNLNLSDTTLCNLPDFLLGALMEFNELEIRAVAYTLDLDADLFVKAARYQYQLDVWEWQKLLKKYDETRSQLEVYKTALKDMLIARDHNIKK